MTKEAFWQDEGQQLGLAAPQVLPCNAVQCCAIDNDSTRYLGGFYLGFHLYQLSKLSCFKEEKAYSVKHVIFDTRLEAECWAASTFWRAF